jgi:signal transduction histidine kinase
MSEPIQTKAHATRDAWLAAFVVLIGGLICVRWDTAERLTAGVLRWEWLQLDDLLLTSFIAISALTWFAMRRLAETRRALALHLASEHEKAKYVAKLEELSAQLLQTEQAERARIGELLHDDVGQTLYACRLQLERALARANEPALRELVAEAHTLAGDAMASTRELTTRISPPVLHDLGLAEAIEWLLARTEQRFGVQTHFESTGPWHAIDETLHEPVFHSVSELITNAVKHAQATNIRVDARTHAQRIEVRVHDDGRGFAPDHSASRGFGLFSIERRMARIGAQLHIESASQQGTCAALQLRASSHAAAE